MSTVFTQRLAPPPALEEGTLRIVPLGGLGDVGRNMTVLEYGGRLLVVDCGVLFPEESQPGVDLILPDFDLIADRLEDVEAIVLTHGHEDHIGAVPYLLRQKPDIPLVGSELTLAFVTAKLREHRIRPVTRTVAEGRQEGLGPFDCEFVAVNHSIPDALAVHVTTPAGTVLHTGDFKMDQLPLDGRITDLRAFARLGEAGVDLFMTDSTNAEVPGFTVGEQQIGPTLQSIFARAQQKIVVASFSSHVHRVQQVLDAAAAHGRKVAFVGRSMVRNMRIAAELGFLEVPEDTLIDVRRIDDLPEEQVVLMCTGSQGEPMAALGRIANRDHRVSVGPGDVVILASSLIPGNENAVFRVVNGLMELGAEVIHKGNATVHTSGHASEGELLYCYNIVRPKNVMPIHGEVRHLIANGRIAEATGVPRERVVLARDGHVVDLRDGIAETVGEVPNGYVYVDGSSVGEISETDLKDRRILGDEGFISLFAVVDSRTGALIAGPEIHARGVAEDAQVFETIRPEIIAALEQAVTEQPERRDTYQLQQVMRRVVGRYVGRRLPRRPMTTRAVVES